MNITVCQLPDPSAGHFQRSWEALIEHTRSSQTELLLLPEMPFSPWMAATNTVDAQVWREAVAAHETWLPRLAELSAAVVLGSRPILEDEVAYNEGFLWQTDGGLRPAHRKYYLPDEPEFWEATWYARGPKTFEALDTRAGKAGFLICTELWFTEHARAYAREDVRFLACPRATPASTVEKWVAGGRAAAVVSGSFCLSSNRGGSGADGVAWGGCGWIIDPEGQVLATTSEEEPCVTVEIDPEAADAAKETYPRYVKE